MIQSSSPEEDLPKQSLNKVLLSLFLLSLLFLVNFLSRIIFSPLLPMIKNELGLDHTSSGSLFLFISSGYFIAILFSSFISSWLNHKNTIFLSTFFSGGIIFLLGYVHSFSFMRPGLFALGLAAGLYLPSGLASITKLVSPTYLARGMAVHELAPNIGFVLAPLLSDLLLHWLTWRETIQWLGILMICVSLVFFFSRGGCTERGQKIRYRVARDLFLQPKFLFIVCLFSLAICSTLGIYAMLPLFLVTSHGMEASHANNLLALSRISSVFMPLLGGWLGDTFGHRPVIAAVLVTGGIMTFLLGETSGNVLVCIAILQPMAAVCFFPSGFAILTQLCSADSGSLAVSLCIPFAFLAGGGFMPTLIGAIGDYYSFHLGFLFVGTLMVVGGIAAICWHSLEK